MTTEAVADLLPAAFLLIVLGVAVWQMFVEGRRVDPAGGIVYTLPMTPETTFAYEHPRAPWLCSDGYRLLCRRCKLVQAFELDPKGIESAARFVTKHEKPVHEAAAQ